MATNPRVLGRPRRATLSPSLVIPGALFGTVFAVWVGALWLGLSGPALTVLAWMMVTTPLFLYIGAALGRGAAVRSNVREPFTEARREFEKARRFGRPLAVLRIARRERSGRTADVEEAQRDERLTRVLHSLRIIDRVWLAGDDILAALPETDRSAAMIVVDRLHADGTIPAGAEIDVITFPEDVLTWAALLGELQRPAGPDGSARPTAPDGLASIPAPPSGGMPVPEGQPSRPLSD